MVEVLLLDGDQSRSVANEHGAPRHSLLIDRSERRVLLDGAVVALTPKEFDLLALLADDVGTVCERQRIIEEVWNPHWFGSTKTLDVHISTLRRKLGDRAWIETVRGVGYRVPERYGVVRPTPG